MPIGYVLRRVGQFFLVLWGAASINFLLPRLAPGNPVRERLISQATAGGPMQAGIEEMVRAYNIEFGLDKPLWVQYARYLWHLMQFDLGYSIVNYPTKVLSLIQAALPWTIGLLAVSSVIAFALGTLLGALMGWPRSPRFVHYLSGPMMALSAIPYYMLGLILIYLLAVLVPVFPLFGGYQMGTVPRLSLPFILDVLKHAILPGLSITLASLGFWALNMRGMMITTQGEDFVNFAEAKGLKPRRIFFEYGVRNAALPQITAFAISFGQVVSGSVVAEVIFGYPGIGNLLFSAINGLDYFLIYGLVFMTVLAIALSTLAIDLLYPLIDPRISYRRS